MEQQGVGHVFEAGDITPAASPRALSPQALLVGVLVIALGGYAVSRMPSQSPIPLAEFTAPSIASHLATLTGAWEGISRDDLPGRLVVEEVHAHWATVLYTWGDHPDGAFPKGWTRVHARVLPDGTLSWRYPGSFTFKLSQDGTTLLGKREQGGRSAISLMRRTPSGAAANLLAPRGN